MREAALDCTQVLSCRLSAHALAFESVIRLHLTKIHMIRRKKIDIATDAEVQLKDNHPSCNLFPSDHVLIFDVHVNHIDIDMYSTITETKASS